MHVFGRGSRKIGVLTALPDRRNGMGCGNYFNVKTAGVGMKVRGNHLLVGWRAYTNADVRSRLGTLSSTRLTRGR